MSQLEFSDVSIRYGDYQVVRSLNLTVPSGQIVGLVGESGCGKSTLARAAVGLQPISTGSIRLDSKPVRPRMERGVQMVFQDPYASLNPRLSIGKSIAEALPKHRHVTRRQRRKEIESLLAQVMIDPERYDQLPTQLSGGQRQRVGIARALAANPSIIIADEITSALDASVQGSVLNLVRNVQRTSHVGVLFISHNLAVVRYISDQIAVMENGQIVETGGSEELIEAPRHRHTRDLLQASLLELDDAKPAYPATASNVSFLSKATAPPARDN